VNQQAKAFAQNRHKMTVALLLIDPQNDFHPPAGSLAVPNADKGAD
jgi:nicotinamidase-related amidase